MTHGFQDDVLPHDTTKEQIEELKAAGMPIDFRSYDKTHTIDPDLEDIRNTMMSMLELDATSS